MVWILRRLISTYSTSTRGIDSVSTQPWMPRTMDYGFAYRPISRNLLRVISLSWVRQSEQVCWITAILMATESMATQSRICQSTWWKSWILSSTTMITDHWIRSTEWRQHTILSLTSLECENESLQPISLRLAQSFNQLVAQPVNQCMTQSMPQSSVI
jgi:hypothetical protein